MSGYYSRALERVFVSSTARSFFGLFPPASFEIVEGKSKPLPVELSNVQRETEGVGNQRLFFDDLPMLNGVLFTGANGEALFYDGVKVTSLLNPYIYGKKLRWIVKTAPISKRVFLKINSYSWGKNFLVEIKPDLKVMPILLPNDDYWSLSEFPNKPNLFWMGDNTVVIELDGMLYPVIHVPISTGMIHDYDNRGDAIAFSIKDNYYFIVSSSPSAQCIAELNPSNPIVLNNP
jgi:hypothetical protein